MSLPKSDALPLGDAPSRMRGIALLFACGNGGKRKNLQQSPLLLTAGELALLAATPWLNSAFATKPEATHQQ